VGLFDKFVVQFGWFSLEREQFLEIAEAFVKFSTPDAIFYGKYITFENDFAIYGATAEYTDNIEYIIPSPPYSAPVVKEPIKPKLKRKQLISQDDIPGTSTTTS
jgi:hypothetical protein